MTLLRALEQKLLAVCHEMRHGGPEFQEASISALHAFLEQCPAMLFPSHLYPRLREIFQYYHARLLSHREIPEGLRQIIGQRLSSVRQRFELQEQSALNIERTLHQFFLQVQRGEFKSIDWMVSALDACVRPGASTSPHADLHQDTDSAFLEGALTQLRCAFTPSQAITFFESLLARMMPEEFQAHFTPVTLLFWDQLQELLHMKVAVVDTGTGEALIMRLDIDLHPKTDGPDDVHIANDCDDGLKKSFQQAVQAARTYLEDYFPERLAKRYFEVRCTFRDPAVIYKDPSASVAVGVKFVGDVLNLPIAADTVISGRIESTGKILPVGSLPAKVQAALQHPAIRQFYLSGRDLPEEVRKLKGISPEFQIQPVFTLTETLERYYGKTQLQHLRHVEDWGNAPEVPVFFGRAAELETLTHWIRATAAALWRLWGCGEPAKPGLSWAGSAKPIFPCT